MRILRGEVLTATRWQLCGPTRALLVQAVFWGGNSVQEIVFYLSLSLFNRFYLNCLVSSFDISNGQKYDKL